MKLPIISILLLVLANLKVLSGQSALTVTYQPLVNPSKSEFLIAPVVCHHWYCNSASSSVDLICSKNVPPSDMPDQANYDLNIASICGIDFSTCDLGVLKIVPELVIDVTNLKIPKPYTSQRKQIILASLECLRRCLPDVLSNTPLTIKGLEKDKEWVVAVVDEFNKHDRSKPFYKSGNSIEIKNK